MIWLDITDPKYVLFFQPFLAHLQKLDSLLITTRKSEGYSECAKLLELFGINAISIGGYGGREKESKLKARLERQQGFLDLFKKIGKPRLFITGASVEGTQTAFGLGIDIVQFSDTPIIGARVDYSLLSIVARLSLPLSTLVFHPFIVPQECFKLLGLGEENLHCYDFIDVALWLKDLKPARDFRERFNIPKDRAIILIREEEYQAHYVKSKLPIIEQSIELLAKEGYNLILMPRYDQAQMQERFKNLDHVYILDQKIAPDEFYPYIDLLIGGGGTMNLESCYLGIPTLSTRSLFLFHDIYLIQNGLMQHCTSAQEVRDRVGQILSSPRQRKDHRAFFELGLKQNKRAGFDEIFEVIKKRFY